MWNTSILKDQISNLKKQKIEENYFELIQIYNILDINSELSVKNCIEYLYYLNKYNSYKTKNIIQDRQIKFYDYNYNLIKNMFFNLNIKCNSVDINDNCSIKIILKSCESFYEKIDIFSKKDLQKTLDNNVLIINNEYLYGRTYYTKYNSFIQIKYFNDKSYLSSYILVHELAHYLNFKNKNYTDYINIISNPFLETIPLFLELTFNDEIKLKDKNMYNYYNNLNINALNNDCEYVLNNKSKNTLYLKANQRIYSMLLAYYLYEIANRNTAKMKEIIEIFDKNIGKISCEDLLELYNTNLEKITNFQFVKKKLYNN